MAGFEVITEVFNFSRKNKRFLLTTHHAILKLTLMLAATLLMASCGRPKPEGFRVISYDSLTGKWKIIRTGYPGGTNTPDTTILLTAVCSSHTHGDAMSRGPEACSLAVGRLYTPNAVHPRSPSDYVYTEQFDDQLTIAVGANPGREYNFLRIIQQEVVPEGISRPK